MIGSSLFGNFYVRVRLYMSAFVIMAHIRVNYEGDMAKPGVGQQVFI